MRAIFKTAAFLVNFTVLSSIAVAPTTEELDLKIQAIAEKVDKLAEVVQQMRGELSGQHFTFATAQTLPTQPSQERSLTVYLIRDVANPKLVGFLEFLRKEIPTIDIKEIKSVNDIPEDKRDKSVILFTHKIVSERMGGYYSAEDYLRCGKESDMHCIFTVIRQYRSGAHEANLVPTAGNMSSNIYPDVDSLEFRYIYPDFHSSKEDVSNRRNIDLLKKILENYN